MYQNTTHCRGCGSANRREVFTLGEIPPTDRLLTNEEVRQINGAETRVPATVLYCEDCSLLQVREVITSPFLSPDSPVCEFNGVDWAAHCRDNAQDLIARRRLDWSHLVVEIGCSHGETLKPFHAQGIPVLGIDSSPRADELRDAGIPIQNEPFSLPLAEKLQQDGRQADVVIVHHELFRACDLRQLARGVGTILKDRGIAVVEAPYVRDLIDACAFASILHDRPCHFSLMAVSKLFSHYGLSVNGVRRLNVRGGMLRIYVEKRRRDCATVAALFAEERQVGIDQFEYYTDFARRVRVNQQSLKSMLTELKNSGKRIAGYSAAGDGMALLNSCGIGRDLLEYVVDGDATRGDQHLPGVHLPISLPERLTADRPDFVVILSRVNQHEIIRQHAEYRRRGGRFIVPVPEPRIV